NLTGKEVVGLVGAKYRRLTITSNTPTALTVSPDPGGGLAGIIYFIGEPGFYWRPEGVRLTGTINTRAGTSRVQSHQLDQGNPQPDMAWCRSTMEPWWTHFPEDAINP